MWVGAETSEYGIGMDGKTIGLRAQDDSGHGIVSPAGYKTRVYDKETLPSNNGSSAGVARTRAISIFLIIGCQISDDVLRRS